MTSGSLANCYCVTLSAQVIEGKENNLSIINLIEGVKLPRPALGMGLPFDVISFWVFAKEAVGRTLETKTAVFDADGNEAVASGGHEFTVDEPKEGIESRARIRTQGLALPKSFGRFQIHMCWREKGEEHWNKSAGSWFFHLEELAPSDEAIGSA